MKKQRVYIVYTGGTIGMRRSKVGYVPVSGYLQQQLRQIPKFNRPELPEFVIHEYEPLIDSADMTPDIWQQIARDIFTQYQFYDAFIVLHGTDTMAYTASALSFILENLQKPVIVTGSQLPIAELRSDGSNNLLNALYLSIHYPINEVCLLFHNKLFRGNRVTKVHSDGFDAFDSPNFPVLIEAGVHIQYAKNPDNLPNNNDPLKLNAMSSLPISIMTLHPGIDRQWMQTMLSVSQKAVILRTYGLGNAPSQNKWFIKLIENSINEGTLIVNLSQCFFGKINMDRYASGSILAEIGVISGFDMTLEATLAKLCYLINKTLDLTILKKLVQQNIRGELTLPLASTKSIKAVS